MFWKKIGNLKLNKITKKYQILDKEYRVDKEATKNCKQIGMIIIMQDGNFKGYEFLQNTK